MIKVAIQGYQASFHDVAAHKMLGNDITIVPCATFIEVFKAVTTGEAEYGVVATGNTIYGPIHESLRLFDMYSVAVCDETSVAIEQCLLVVPKTDMASVEYVYSHPVALAQCKEFIADYLPNAHLAGHADTAGAAADVARWNDPKKAAIASRAAAELHGLQVAAANIQSEKENRTSFSLFKAA
jgi:prephenate dehydratase